MIPCKRFALVFLLALSLAAFASCASDDDDDSSSGEDANDDVDDDANDDSDDDMTADDDDDEQTTFPYEFAPPPSNEEGIFVAKTGDDNNPGTMELPKLSISAGVELAELEDKSVFVAQGDYHESVVTQGVSLFGGYESEAWQRKIKEYTTTIIATEENGVETSLSLIIEGFSIFGGKGTEENPISSSRGVLVNNSATISNCIIFGGRPDEYAYGLECDFQGILRVFNSIIIGSNTEGEDVSSIETYGIKARLPEIAIVNSIIHGGSSELGEYSHGVWLSGDLMSVVIVSSNIYGGDPMGTDSYSTGISVYGPREKFPFWDFVLINSIVNGGTGAGNSLALYIENGNYLSIFNNNIWGTTTDCLFAYGFFNFVDFSFEEFCFSSIEEINGLNIPVYEGVDVSGNISTDPLLVDPDNQDWHLRPESACLDAGADAWVDWRDMFGTVIRFEGFCEAFHLDDVLKYDFEGEPRNNGYGWDIGPDELWPEESGDDDTGDDDTPSDFSCVDDICTDLSSGLMWQNGDENELGADEALSYCGELIWGGYDDWRLPTISELRSLIRGCPETEAGGACNVTDDCLDHDCWNYLCDGCMSDFGPGPEGEYWPEQLETGRGWRYWSSSGIPGAGKSWGVIFDSGYIFNGSFNDGRARCVRDAN